MEGRHEFGTRSKSNRRCKDIRPWIRRSCLRGTRIEATAVVAKGLVKQYRRGPKALDGIDITIEQGEVFGLLGPNGAGKTTFVKCMLGLLRPSSGSITLFGASPQDPSVRKRVGFAPEIPHFPPLASPHDIMRLHASLAGVSSNERDRKIDELLHAADLSDAPNRIKAFSKGMIRRLALAQAELGDPQFLVLDEPTADLDPIGRRQVRDDLLRFKESGRTVVLNSHLLSEVERVCDKVAIIHKGKLLAMGSLEKLVPEDRDLESVFIELVERAGG